MRKQPERAAFLCLSMSALLDLLIKKTPISRRNTAVYQLSKLLRTIGVLVGKIYPHDHISFFRTFARQICTVPVD